MTSPLASIKCKSDPLCIKFIPIDKDVTEGEPPEDCSSNLIAAGLVGGTIEIHKYQVPSNSKRKINSNDSNNEEINTLEYEASKKNNDEMKKKSSVRCLSYNDNVLYSGGTNQCYLSSIDVAEQKEIWSLTSSSSSSNTGSNNIGGIYSLLKLRKSNLLATGEENGIIKLYDVTCQKSICQWSEHDDYISQFYQINDVNFLASSADGSLSLFDIRKASASASSALISSTDHYQDEFLSMTYLSHKIIVGTQTGPLLIFSNADKLQDYNLDKFLGHPSSIETMEAIDGNTIVTGSDDGLIRLVQIHPNQLLGVIASYEDGFPVEELQFNSSKRVMATISHEPLIRLWDTSMLDEDSDGSDESDDENENKQTKIELNLKSKRDSDDEWDDDKDSEDGSDSDDDSSEGKTTVSRNKKRKFKTQNELFFADL